MAHYIDGFVFTISSNRLAEYRQVVETVAEIWKEHGALAYCEYVGDDMHRQGTLSFSELCSAASDAVVIFGWVEFESRESRDLVNQRVEADPRIAKLVEPLMIKPESIFDAKRMAYGGFKPLITLLKGLA